ncbi:hypothetical protein [Mycolicibacterium farcinogenes]|uniref:Uncharacterized protein n=1 Tax=Mycolicibacterium farcinogenes TaxID=1802 RepID=A0ACD1FDL3_MYCFR|nr:hypothetical protein [Mycolicibacterium farcinogenes]QZH65005.1 hypothetical protein K6L26_23840 [Mycolicibacterium farcinogenes]
MAALSAETIADIRARAKELADAAPALTSQQAHLLTSLASRHSERKASISA